MIKVKWFPVGELAANCYFVYDEEEGVSLLIDTGAPCEEMYRAVEAFGADKLQYLLLTHGHFDHIGNASAVREKYPQVKIVIGEKDKDFTQRDSLNLSLFFEEGLKHFDADILVNEGDELPFGRERIKVLSTPGHTAGGVCYIIGDSVFTGDTLISGSCGRTDFPTGSGREMIASLRRLAELPGDMKVYCGHGESSTLEYERRTNFCMRSDEHDDIY